MEPALNESIGMTPLGWIIFLLSNIIVIWLTAFCFYRVLAIQREHMHAPLDIDTHDLNDKDENEDNGREK